MQWFERQGARLITLPPELYAGIDYAAHLLDPEGGMPNSRDLFSVFCRILVTSPTNQKPASRNG